MRINLIPDKQPVIYCFLLQLFIISFTACHKTESICFDDNLPVSDFEIMEQVGDTSLTTDTAYVHTRITFKSSKTTDSVSWKIGNSSTIIFNENFDLIFNNPETINVALSLTQTNSCNDKVKVHKKKDLVIPDNTTSNVSPLAGKYRGIVKGERDSFTIEVKFWFGDRYTWWPNGAYSIHNFPKDYKDSTQNFNGYSRPEIDGIICSTGYLTRQQIR